MVTCWIITGGCGFIGRNLIKKLLAEGGHFIRIIDNLKVGSRNDLALVCDFTEVDSNLIEEPTGEEGVELVVGNILDAILAEKACRGMNVIVHLAANTGVAPSVADPRLDCENNVMGTFNYLEGARINNIRCFVFASSGAPVGEVEPPIHEELPPHPVSPYGASKLAGEGYCSAYYNSFGVKTVCLRFGNVYGPLSGKKNSVVAKFIKKALKGEELKIFGDGTQTRDFIYIDDLVRSIRISVIEERATGQIFQIATNTETTIGELVVLLLPILEKKGIKNVVVKHGEKLVGDVRRNFSNTMKAQELLGWHAETSLSKGLVKTVEWFINNR